MGAYDHSRFRQVLLDAEVYRRLERMKGPGDTFADVIRRLLPEIGRPSTKRGRPVEEILALARNADLAWRRRLRKGEVRPRV